MSFWDGLFSGDMFVLGRATDGQKVCVPFFHMSDVKSPHVHPVQNICCFLTNSPLELSWLICGKFGNLSFVIKNIHS